MHMAQDVSAKRKEAHMSPRETWDWRNVVLVVILALLMTAPPAAPQSEAGVANRKQKDERLKQIVTSRVTDEPLRSWLDHLGQETGVQLQAAPDYEDPAITVRVKAMPLGELMEAVASLYGDNWRPGRKQEDADYILEASQARRSRQHRFVQTYQHVLLTEITRQANDIVRYGDQAGLFDSLPFDQRTLKRLEYQSRPRGKVVSQLGPDVLTRLLSGERIAIRVDEATGALGAALRELVATYAMPVSDGWTAQDQDSAWVVLYSDSHRHLTQDNIDTGLPQRSISMDIGPPGRVVRQSAVGIPGDRLFERLTAALTPLQRAEEQDPRERSREGATFLQRVLPTEMKPENGPYAEQSQMFAAIADAADVNLIADSHTKPKRLTPPLGGRSVEEVLAVVCDLWQSNWRVQHSTILVRSRNWWTDDPAEPPATAMAEWQAAFQAKGVLQIEDAARIAALSREQQQRLALRIPEARTAFSPWLRFYASLDTAHKEALRSPRGLDLRIVPAPERLQLISAGTMSDLLANGTAMSETVASGKVVLNLSEEARGGRPAVVFSYSPLGATRQPVRSATVWLPWHASASSRDVSARGEH
jgi:hypothetical protein